MELDRFGLIGDVHCEDDALERALDFLAGDPILVVGDIVDGLGDADRCCALIEERGALAVKGNHDRWLIEGTMRDLPNATEEVTHGAFRFLTGLPLTREFDTAAGKLLLCHAVGANDLATLKADTRGYGLRDALAELSDFDVNLVACGHTHDAMVRKAGGYTFINAGTLHRNYDSCFMRVHISKGEIERFGFSPGPVLEETLELCSA